jgi:basic amino acid/polyamine antiporter, APA family
VSAPPSVTLERRLGPIDAASVVVSNVIGSGILVLPAVVAIIAPNPWAILGIWAFGGLLALAGAMAYAEMATLRPRSGGEYVYLREAFGPLAAFLTGWTSFVAGFSGAIAVTSMSFAGYLGRFFAFASDTTPFFSVPLGVMTLSLNSQSLVALLLIFALSGIHMIGLGPGRAVQNVLAVIKFAALIVFVFAGLMFGNGSWDHFQGGSSVPPSGWLLALIPVMFSYSGWNAAAYIAEEIKDPSRNLPRALALGTIAVVIAFVLMNIVYLYALPVPEMQKMSMRIVDSAADRLFGPTAGNLLALVSLMIFAGSISAMVFAGPRVYLAMARDGLFLPQAARVHPVYRTPAFAIAAQAVWSGLLVVSGTFEQLALYTGFAVLLFASVAVSALFVLRRRYPNEPRPFRAWGYPVAPTLFVIAGYAGVLNAFWREPGPSFRGVVLIAVGIPLYYLVKTRLNRSQQRLPLEGEG